MRISILLTCFTILISTFGSAQQIKRNLIANSCFEEGLKHWYTTCEPNINVNYYIDKDTPISGSASALISVDQPGSHSHDAMLYVLFPVEKNAKYKICFKAMCSRKEQLKLEFCSDHGDYIPPVIEIRPESFKSEYDDDRLKGVFPLLRKSGNILLSPDLLTRLTGNTSWHSSLQQLSHIPYTG